MSQFSKLQLEYYSRYEFPLPISVVQAMAWELLEASRAGLLVAKSRAEIESEIAALAATAKDYDTERQSNDTCLAAGAHDALRWLLGLAEAPISETLRHEP